MTRKVKPQGFVRQQGLRHDVAIHLQRFPKGRGIGNLRQKGGQLPFQGQGFGPLAATKRQDGLRSTPNGLNGQGQVVLLFWFGNWMIVILLKFWG